MSMITPKTPAIPFKIIGSTTDMVVENMIKSSLSCNQ